MLSKNTLNMFGHFHNCQFRQQKCSLDPFKRLLHFNNTKRHKCSQIHTHVLPHTRTVTAGHSIVFNF